MPRFDIDSIDDPRIAPYRDLTRRKLSRDSGLFIAEGRTLVERLLASEFEVHSVLVERRYIDSTGSLVLPEVPLYVTPDGLVDQIAGFQFHRGVLACGRRREQAGITDIIPTDNDRLALVVGVGIGDQENLGGFVRNCAALGADAVVLGAGCADPFARRVLRVSMGTVLNMPIVESNDLVADLAAMRDCWQCELIATVLDTSAEPLDEAVTSNRFTLLFGSEGHGLDPHWLDLCDRKVTIPMSRGTDSLNVATASGIILHHFTRGTEQFEKQ